MRLLCAMLVSLTVLSGLMMRVHAMATGCASMGCAYLPSHGPHHTHGGPHDCDHHSHASCAASDHQPGESPARDLGSHGDCDHHHHGTCVHGLPLCLHADGTIRVPILHTLLLRREILHQQVPDGPVCELDKPPLI
jgi:hypothetical protein